MALQAHVALVIETSRSKKTEKRQLADLPAGAIYCCGYFFFFFFLFSPFLHPKDCKFTGGFAKKKKSSVLESEIKGSFRRAACQRIATSGWAAPAAPSPRVGTTAVTPDQIPNDISYGDARVKTCDESQGQLEVLAAGAEEEIRFHLTAFR